MIGIIANPMTQSYRLLRVTVGLACVLTRGRRDDWSFDERLLVLLDWDWRYSRNASNLFSGICSRQAVSREP